jgi:hypothetical protein
MQNTFTIILSGLLLCGCSQKQASPDGPAIERVKVGDTLWNGGVYMVVQAAASC